MYKLITCFICQRTFNGQIPGIHLKTHDTNTHDYELNYGPSRDPQLILDAKLGGRKGGGNQHAIDAIKVKSQKQQEKYLLNPKTCSTCYNPIPYDRRYNKFCSHSCSAIDTNRKRIESGYTLSQESRNSIRDKLSIFAGPYSKLSTKTCKFCNTQFITPATNRTQVCNNCRHLKWNNNKDQYSFRFNVFDYPDLFDLDNLNLVGWVAFGGKRGGKKNIDGLSRDHRISVNEAKKFNYDPYYISHPLNCELMPHQQNNKKKTKSSITYEELVKLVDEYDNRGDH
jgi:endogenous inhibitor of DNA gyrase (YacG/DUF329 family)